MKQNEREAIATFWGKAMQMAKGIRHTTGVGIVRVFLISLTIGKTFNFLDIIMHGQA
jgi:hypothetical protein